MIKMCDSSHHVIKPCLPCPAIGLHNIPPVLSFTPASICFKGNQAERDANPLWVEIKTVRLTTPTLWFLRITREFESKAKPTSTTKTKKASQESPDGLSHKFDLTLLFDWLMQEGAGTQKIHSLFRAELVCKYNDMWLAGPSIGKCFVVRWVANVSKHPQ
jgi:hypothetical protein